MAALSVSACCALDWACCAAKRDCSASAWAAESALADAAWLSAISDLACAVSDCASAASVRALPRQTLPEPWRPGHLPYPTRPELLANSARAWSDWACSFCRVASSACACDLCLCVGGSLAFVGQALLVHLLDRDRARIFGSLYCLAGNRDQRLSVDVLACGIFIGVCSSTGQRADSCRWRTVSAPSDCAMRSALRASKNSNGNLAFRTTGSNL